MNVKQKCFLTPPLMTLTAAVSKSTSLPSTWNLLTAPPYFIWPRARLLLNSPSLSSPLSHSLPPLYTSSQALKGHFVDIWGGVCLQVLRLHTSLSFGITTEKQHSHLHEKSSVGEGKGEGECSEGCGSEASCGKREPVKTDNNGGICRRKQPPHLSSSCSKSSWV